MLMLTLQCTTQAETQLKNTLQRNVRERLKARNSLESIHFLRRNLKQTLYWQSKKRLNQILEKPMPLLSLLKEDTQHSVIAILICSNLF